MDASGATDEGACLRTAKSRGPDAPTLASSLAGRNSREMTVARKPGHRGERAISRKTIARGMPGVSGVTVVTNACVLFIFAHKAAGAQWAPGIPCALCLQRV
jgi:hypothetical protein